MEERILVYKNPNYDVFIKKHKWAQQRLQEIADGLKLLGINPTDELIKRLLNGEDLQLMIAEKNVTDGFKNLPRAMLKAMKEMVSKENREDYMNAVGEKAEHFRAIIERGDSLIDMAFFSVHNGIVVLLPEHIKEAERLFCVFVDTPAQKCVYEKWQQLKDAVSQFEQAVKEAPKKPMSKELEAAKIYPQYLRGIMAPGNYSIAKFLDDGSVELNGWNFEHIQ